MEKYVKVNTLITIKQKFLCIVSYVPAYDWITDCSLCASSKINQFAHACVIDYECRKHARKDKLPVIFKLIRAGWR